MKITTNWQEAPVRSIPDVCIGRIVHITPERKLLVDFPGNQSGPLEARLIVYGWLPQSTHELINTLVLIIFEDRDYGLPIVVGPVADTLPVTTAATGGQARSEGQKVVTLDAGEELVLRCGESSLSLKKDGKIVLKGNRIVSRASMSNKIKGGSVDIN